MLSQPNHESAHSGMVSFSLLEATVLKAMPHNKKLSIKFLILAFLVVQCHSHWSEENDYLAPDFCRDISELENSVPENNPFCIQPGEENQPSIIVKDTLPGTVIQCNKNPIKILHDIQSEIEFVRL